MAAEISNGIAGNSDKSLSKRIKGSTIIAKALRHIGVQYIFGVIGIPVTAIACEAQKEGIRYIGFRNEQAAGYAASAVGFITGRPAVLLTVSGPGLVHGLAGLANATVNGWPMLMLSGSIERDRFGHSGFQELDQVEVLFISLLMQRT
jgi:2-hydroxyacyl-CoA lyase 1